MASAPPAKRGFSPLDEELALLPGQLTPLLQDHLAHLGTWMPFAHAAQMLSRFTQGLRITFVLLLRSIIEDFQNIVIIPSCTQPLLTEAGFQRCFLSKQIEHQMTNDCQIMG